MAQLPKEPSRHRVALWRELRKAGAVPVSAGTWGMPAGPAFQPAIERAREVCEKGGGRLAVIDASPRDPDSLAMIHDAFKAARLDEWTEFEADCGKFEAEIVREIDKKKFTFGELEEEEQSLERLRRWHQDLMKRDVLELAEATQAQVRLQGCVGLLEGYAEMVYDVMRGETGVADTPHVG